MTGIQRHSANPHVIKDFITEKALLIPLRDLPTGVVREPCDHIDCMAAPD